jgi:type III pantothenate kinase
VGPDRIANAVAVRERHGAPAIVVDFGTSTNFDVVNAAGEFAGGVVAPGVEISMDALFARAARLPRVPFVAPDSVISQTTTAALQSGLVYGFAGQIDAIVTRIKDELGANGAPVVATGGLADLIAPHAETITAVDPELTLHGLRIVWDRNRG